MDLVSLNFDLAPHLKDSERETLQVALQWWLRKYATRPPRAIYWDTEGDKKGLGGHFVGLTNKIFLNPNQDLKEILRCLFHELWHMKRWQEGGGDSWFQKGANLFVLHVSREEEESYVDTQALADVKEFLKVCEARMENQVQRLPRA